MQSETTGTPGDVETPDAPEDDDEDEKPEPE